MVRNVQEIDSENTTGLAAAIISKHGQDVIFSNGCYLSLKVEDGVYWGTSPYGTDWCCNADSEYVAKIICWVAYWDAPRDECGRLIDIRGKNDAIR